MTVTLRVREDQYTFLIISRWQI